MKDMKLPRNPFSFFFYDLETSGLNPREDRIMQFAGQRTDQDFRPIGDPVNILLKLPDDTLPSPGAIMVTKITPQSTQTDGLTEAEFCRFLSREIFTPGTCAIGYNSVRFDDEFMRHLWWRNFRDPYEWQWRDGRSRWDLLDVVRLTRALRPEGIVWPVATKTVTDPESGEAKIIEVPVNKLELLTKLNHIEHSHAHDALSDVMATIAVARLIKEHQSKLYQFLFDLREKKSVHRLVNLDQKKPFVYASGRYPAQFNKTTVAFPIAPGRNGNLLVFDLRYNLDQLLESSPETFFPIVKELAPNKCPAIAPLGVLEQSDGWHKIGLTHTLIQENLDSLLSHPEFAEKMRTEYEARLEWPAPPDPESALYDAFLSDQDRRLCSEVAVADAEKLADFHPAFTDERLPDLLLHYKAKNFPTALSADEAIKWEEYRIQRLTRQAANFVSELTRLQNLASTHQPLPNGEPVDEFILEELALWFQSLQTADY